MNRWCMTFALLAAAPACEPDRPSQTVEVSVETEGGSWQPDLGFFVELPPDVLDATLDVLDGDRDALARHLTLRGPPSSFAFLSDLLRSPL